MNSSALIAVPPVFSCTRSKLWAKLNKFPYAVVSSRSLELRIATPVFEYNPRGHTCLPEHISLPAAISMPLPKTLGKHSIPEGRTIHMCIVSHTISSRIHSLATGIRLLVRLHAGKRLKKGCKYEEKDSVYDEDCRIDQTREKTGYQQHRQPEAASRQL